MKDIMRNVDSAFRMISSIPVAGDAVDTMAVARAKLKEAYRQLEELDTAIEEKKKEEDECPTQ